MPKTFPEVINERSTASYGFKLEKKDGTPVPASALSSATMTLSLPGSGAIVNGRDHQNILNANNVTLDEQGVGTFDLQVADTTIQDASLGIEVHRATLWFVWSGGAKTHEVDFQIANLGKVP